MQTRRSMLRAMFLTGASVVMAPTLVAATSRKTEIKLFKKHYAPCCDGWMSHLARSGFAVREVGVTDLDAVKKDYEIPKSLVACHTAVCEGYIIEGHVPAEYIQKLLRDHPFVRGIAVAATPVGAPGNEKKGQKDPFDVVAFDSAGRITPFTL